MNSLRIRVAKLTPNAFGAGYDFLFAVQLSEGGLNWWTVNRFKTFDEALGNAKDLETFIRNNQLVKPTNLLWKTDLR